MAILADSKIKLEFDEEQLTSKFKKDKTLMGILNDPVNKDEEDEYIIIQIAYLQ